MINAYYLYLNGCLGFLKFSGGGVISIFPKIKVEIFIRVKYAIQKNIATYLQGIEDIFDYIIMYPYRVYSSYDVQYVGYDDEKQSSVTTYYYFGKQKEVRITECLMDLYLKLSHYVGGYFVFFL